MRELLQAVPADLVYVSLLVGILLVPKLLQGTHVPGPVWALLLGLLAGMTFPEYSHDPVISLLATLGIASLFLFAGLEVEAKELRSAWRPLVVHLAVRCVGLVIVAVLAVRWKGFDPWAAGLLALALLTPSTGFILDTLARLGLSDETQFWIKSKAIAGELLVIGFAHWVLPHAPGSEFSFLIVVGVVAAYATKQLGVYYLVGAFIAGFVARQLTHRVPELGAHDTMNALKLFAGFFVPFYFFHAGQGIPPEAISWDALGVGLGLTAVLLPLRVGAIVLHRVLHLREPWLDAVRVAMPLSPTLIFTMVLASILHEEFGIPATLYGGLLVYAVMSTLIPALVKQDVELDLTVVRRRTS
jgi:Kef-type K+ transport system membrane component KefB